MRYLTPLLAATAAIILSTVPASADLGDQLHKLLPDDGAVFESFGHSVAISGTTAIIGAVWDSDNGSLSGSAYLFDTTTGFQIAKLLPNDGAEGDRFGLSLSISGNIAIVGAPLDDDNGEDSGSAYLFDTTTGKQIIKLLPNDGGAEDLFGISVAISGASGNEVAIVGAFLANDNGTNSGSVYLFDTSTGKQIAKLLPNDGAELDEFGVSVAINDETVIVGARFDNDNGYRSGSAYLFDTTTGKQIAKILPIDGAAEDQFGYSVAISNTPGNKVAIVGALANEDNGFYSGSAYLFDATTGLQIAKLLPDDNVEGDQFGYSVAINGTTAIIGAMTDDDNGSASGSAYLYDTTTGRQIAKLIAKDGAQNDLFGDSVAISGATAIVGAVYDDDNGSDSGSAYIFDATNVAPCPWDLDNSGSVGTNDLLALFAQWGTDGPADFDGSGTVNTSDLLILFANWGPCE